MTSFTSHTWRLTQRYICVCLQYGQALVNIFAALQVSFMLTCVSQKCLISERTCVCSSVFELWTAPSLDWVDALMRKARWRNVRVCVCVCVCVCVWVCVCACVCVCVVCPAICVRLTRSSPRLGASGNVATEDVLYMLDGTWAYHNHCAGTWICAYWSTLLLL